ncbi:S8 family serine peptidase [bacterium]|nr:S8 family serine peptidase [bacterium]
MRGFWGLFILCSMFLVQAESVCLYSKIQNAYEKNYLLVNLIETLTKTHEIKTSDDVVTGWKNAQQEVHQQCQVSQSFDLQNVVAQGPSDFQLQISGAPYRLQQVKQSDGKIVTALSKLSGNYQNEPIVTIVRKDQVKDFVHVVGREAGSIKDTRYDFVFVGEESFLIHQSPRDYARVDQIRSMKAIYGQETSVVKPRAIVGVVGSGIDYNHPFLARFLGHRQFIEADLQKIENLRKQLQFDIFSSKDNFIEMKNQYLAMSNNVGFPRWADQALGTIEPMDRVIENGLPKFQGVTEHETRVTSRIINDRQDVQVYFARRMMGFAFDKLDVKKVIGEFSKSGVQAVNLSFGASCGYLPKEEITWRDVFKENPQMIFVIAAGNSGNNLDYEDHCPAKYSREFANVISVTALDGDGNIAMYVDPKKGGYRPVNFGLTVDVAMPSNHLPVLVPNKYQGWENNENGATSLAAAEVSRVIVAAIADGYKIDPMTIKKKLQQTSQKLSQLKELVGSGGRIDEASFRASLEK